MIKVNLTSGIKPASLAAEASGFEGLGEADSQSLQKQGFFRLLIIVMGPLLLYVYEQQVVPGKIHGLQQKQKILQDLNQKNMKAAGAVEETKKFKEDQSTLQSQIGTIEGLRKDRMREVKILDAIQREIPEKMWLTKIELRDKKLNVNGFAATDSELTGLMDVLSRSIYLKDVNLVRASEKVYEGHVMKEFSVSAQIDVSAPPATGGVQ